MLATHGWIVVFTYHMSAWDYRIIYAFCLDLSSKLQPAPINHEAETSFQPHLDNSALKNYYIFKKTTKNQTTHQQPVPINLHTKHHLTCHISTQASNLCWFSCQKGHGRWTREVCSAVNKLVLNCTEKKVTSHLTFSRKELPPVPQSHTLSPLPTLR